MNWKSVIGAIAPTLATALGGPLAGSAVNVLSQVVLGKTGGTESEIEAVISGGLKPEVMLALKQADMNFKLEMRRADIEEERVHASDRDSARKREMEVKDKIPAVLAIFSISGFFLVFGALMAFDIPIEAKDPLMIMLGMLSAIVGGVVNYYFGSSAGSAAKTNIIDRMNK